MLFSPTFHHGFRALLSSCAGILAVVAAVGFIGGCSTAPPTTQVASAYAGKSIEEQVRDRATKRWEALIRGDLDGAYAFFSRATRDTYPMDLYRVKMKVGMWRRATVDSVKCEDSVCDVTVTVNMEHSRLKEIITPVRERWIVQEGVAWYVYNG